MSSVATLLDNQSGLLSMPGWAHITKLCKDIGKEVDTVFDPNTHRFGSSFEVGHTWKRFQTASAPLALSWGHLLRSIASLNAALREGASEMCKNKVNLYFPAVWKCFWRTVDTPWQIHWSEIPSFRDHDLFSQVHYLWKKASVLQNQLKTTRQNGRIKKTTASAQLIRVFEILIYQIKWLSSKEVDVAIKNNGVRLWVSFKVTVKCQTSSIATVEVHTFPMLNEYWLLDGV